MRICSVFGTLIMISLFSGSAQAAAKSYQAVVQNVAAMVGNNQAQALARAKGLQILNVLWEDTGRFQGSSVGPNISDVTIEVEMENRRGQLRTALMPVIRYPNFKDKTGDIRLDNFYIRVGNEKKGRRLRTVSLKAFLRHPKRYMSLPFKGRIKGGSLLARRDKHLLVSAQAAFLPIRRNGKATFRPVIFNYQSYKKNPAVLTLLVTREGTSMTIIDNNRDTVSGGRSWGQRLFFNQGGQRAALTAERLSDVKRRGVTDSGQSADSLGKDANLLMLIQVPLKVKRRHRGYGLSSQGSGGPPTGMSKSMKPSRSRGGRSDVEAAVLGHGRLEGPYTELDGLTIQRDPRFPVRVTVQFYQATSNGVINQDNVNAFAAQIAKVYAKADYVGSLVVPDGSYRPTHWQGTGPAPKNTTWQDFPGLQERFKKHGFGVPWHQYFEQVDH